MKASYVRLYADANGESHFSDEEADLRPVAFAPPAPPLDLSPFASATGTALMGLSAGWVGDWHPTPQRQVFLCLAGETEVEVSDGETRRFKPGSILLGTDTSGKGHVTRSLDGDALWAIVQLADGADFGAS